MDAMQAERLHPFKIYCFPTELRASPDPETDWRKFRVRGGVVIMSRIEPYAVRGTDGAKCADSDERDESDVSDVLVPADCESYFFWIEGLWAEAEGQLW